MVEARGFEPKSVNAESTSTYAESEGTPGAKSGALAADSAPQGRSETPGDTPPDADLQAVIAAWPGLSEAVRARIVAMVQAADGGGC